MTTITMTTVTTNKAPDIHVYAPSYEHAMQALVCRAHIVSLNGPALGLRGERNSVSWEQIASLVTIANQQGSRIYLRLNTILHNRDIESLDDILHQAETTGVHAIIFSDAALVYQKQSGKCSIPLMMATETTVTNSEMLRFWYGHGVDGFLLSRELSLEEIARLIADKPNLPGRDACNIEIQIHGPVAIFHTLRPVLSNYHAFLQNKQSVDLCLETAFREEKRPEELYRVNEDSRGTYIYAAYDISLYPYSKQLLEMGVDSLRIDIHPSQSVDTLKQVVQFYQEAVHKAMSDTWNIGEDWRQELEKINGFPIKNQFIKLGAPL